MQPAERWLRKCERKVRREMAGQCIDLSPGRVFITPREQWFHLRRTRRPLVPRNRRERKTAKMVARRNQLTYKGLAIDRGFSIINPPLKISSLIR